MANLNSLFKVIHDLSNRISALELINHAKVLQFGNIILNAETGKITVGANDEIVIDAENEEINVADGSIIIKGTEENVGITVKSGKMTIKDDSETTVIDSKGIVSTASFTFNTVYEAGPTLVTSTVLADVPNMSLSFTLSRSANVLILSKCSVSIEGENQDNVITTTIKVDSKDLDEYAIFGGGNPADNIQNGMIGNHVVATLASGSHTIKTRYKIDASITGDCYLRDTRLTYLILGK